MLIPAFWISFASSSVIVAPFSTITSPVSVFNILSNAIWFVILELKSNFLLYLYLPTFAKSYLLGSKNKLLNNVLAASTVGNSPGLNFLYISIRASSFDFAVSFDIVANIFSSSPNKLIICSSVTNPIALNNVVTGNFLVLSILT